MNRAAAIAIACIIPGVAVAFYALTRWFNPIWGYFGALAVYWAALAVLIARYWRATPPRLTWRLPHWGVWAVQLLVLVGVAGAAALAVGDTPAVLALLPLIAAFALINGTLEEVFWRGVLLPDPSPQAAWRGCALFVGWHLALLPAAGVAVTGGALGLLGGAAMGGALWTLARLQTGTIGFCIAAHVGLNLFAFTELVARNI